MNLAGNPLIPLYQVQADPNARFQRFGRNDGQLFGRPINAELQAQRRTVEPVRERPPTERERTVGEREVGAAAAKPAQYAPSGRGEPASAGTLGASLDLKA